MKNKLIASILGLLLLVSNSAIFAEPMDKSQGDNLFDLGIIKGTGNGLDEDKLINRESFITILVRLLDTTEDVASFVPPKNPSFTDVPTTHWAYKEIELAKHKNLTKGIGNGKFGIGQNVNYNQIELFLTRSLGYDTKDISYNKASEDVATQYGLKLEKKIPGNDSLYRGEVFELLSKTLLMETKEGGLKINKLNYEEEKINSFKENHSKAKVFNRESLKKEESPSSSDLPKEFPVLEYTELTKNEKELCNNAFIHNNDVLTEIQTYRKESPAKVKTFINKYLKSNFKKLELNNATVGIFEQYSDFNFSTVGLTFFDNTYQGGPINDVHNDFYQAKNAGFFIEGDFIFSYWANTYNGGGENWNTVSEIRQYDDVDNLKVYAIFYKSKFDENAGESWLAIAVDADGKVVDCAGKNDMGNLLK